MHIFPQLRKLEKKYGEALAVVGVHSAKFPQERETDSLRRAVLRYGIEHPVVNDRDFGIWSRYTVRTWPTLMFIDPQGKVLGKHEGEFQGEAMDGLLAKLISQFETHGLIHPKPLPILLERDKEKDGALSFPGKVLADPAGHRLFVADSNHQRIVVTSPSGRVEDIIGSGEAGLNDGGFTDATFNDPQGMALDGDTLYVADTKNHAVRKISLTSKSVTTIAGDGKQSLRFYSGGPGSAVQLNSPWDVTIHNGVLYIAMAGFHQLWRLDLATGTVAPHAGTGREHIQDGPLAESALAQPSGITNDGTSLFFTDSETSSVRRAGIALDGHVTSIVGLDLFTFGDVDGSGDDVRLQHPLGICMLEANLLIADTYNNKIKLVMPDTRTVATLLGGGAPGLRDGAGQTALFNEPGGLSIMNGKLYIADTNNHAIRVADLQTLEVSTLEVH
ncbi:MAG: alkyl hydroperoxide reductase [SAR202 cluster bacterium]|nr:alkyl hydroperoxide reductase [SAR202 cluster bacterium]